MVKVVVLSSLAFYNRLYLVPKTNNKWRPILDPSHLNLFLAPGTFKMETPETIRLSLQQGQWITSLDINSAYFHIPISPRSRKYFRFHLKSPTSQFTALPRRGFSAEERQTQPASGPTVQCCSGTCFLHSGTRSMSIQFFMKL